jgi:hypothetical protein
MSVSCKLTSAVHAAAAAAFVAATAATKTHAVHSEQAEDRVLALCTYYTLNQSIN